MVSVAEVFPVKKVLPQEMHKIKRFFLFKKCLNYKSKGVIATVTLENRQTNRLCIKHAGNTKTKYPRSLKLWHKNERRPLVYLSSLSSFDEILTSGYIDAQMYKVYGRMYVDSCQASSA